MRRIAFVRQEPGRRGSSLYVIRRDGGGLERLTRGEQVVAMPARSPNRRTIAYAASPLAGGSFDIWAMPARDGRPFLARGGPAEEIEPRWSRAGRLTALRVKPGDPFPEKKRRDADTADAGPHELLPDFDQRAPFRLTIAGTKLGFASATDNVGDGPIWIRSSRRGTDAPMLAQQIVRLSHGGVRS